MLSLTKADRERIEAVLSGLRQNERVLQMKNYRQHGRVSTYDHCENVARLCYALNRRFRLGADEETLLRDAMLHDLFLYDWHEKDAAHRWHGFRHASAAAENAERWCGAGEDVCRMIRCHMWPLNLTHLPGSREAWILCFADKYASLSETLLQRRRE